jgi:hypothetical protein
LASLATFYGYSIIDNKKLSPKTAFVTLFLFDLIRVCVYRIPQFVSSAVTTFISIRRIFKFLNESEREEQIIEDFRSEVDEFIGNKLKEEIISLRNKKLLTTKIPYRKKDFFPIFEYQI